MLKDSLSHAVLSAVGSARAIPVGIAEGELQLRLTWRASSKRSVGARGKLGRAITASVLILKVGKLGVVLGQSSQFHQALGLLYHQYIRINNQ